MNQLDVLAVIRAPLEQYPPSLYQLALLAEAGLKITVVDASHADYDFFTFRGPHRVERLQPCKHVQTFKEKLPNAAVRLGRSLRFRGAVRQIIKQRSPKLVIAYDPNAMAAVGRLWEKKARPLLLWHFHEFCATPRKSEGVFTAAGTRFACRNANEPDLVIFPDANRGAAFASAVGLKKTPEIVMNCPRRLEALPENTLARRLSAVGHHNPRSVFFQGWLGPNRGLEELILSVKLWPADGVLVLVGPAPQAYKLSLMKLSATTGVSSRVVFIDMVPLQELDGLIGGADVAVALFPSDTDDLNFRYLAGASNKRFMYMALGVAQVANTGPGMSEIIERPRCGLLVNPRKPDEVGGAIRTLLQDESLRGEMGRNGRQAHLAEFNYEQQFSTVLDQILKWCNDRKG